MPRSEQGAPQQPFTRPLFIIAASFLAAILVLALVIIVGTSGGEETPDDAAGESAAAGGPSPEKSETADTSGDCPDFPKSPATEPTTAPKAEWQLFRTVALPSSADHGPAQVDGDLARCFARTPSGAVLASMQIPVRTMLAADWRPVAERQTTGPGKEQLIQAREQSGPPPEPDMGELGQMAGFGIVTYSPDTAVLEVVTRFSDTGTLQVSTITLKWSSKEGDWQYELAGSPPTKTVDSLAGYVPFGGL